MGKHLLNASAIYLYPNPAYNSLSIHISLEESVAVRASLFNSAGQKVSEVVNEELKAGKHRFEMNVRMLPTGAYMLQTEVNGVSTAWKLLITD
ncbi:MAG: T9SS type A sorting domain-containing protein [Phaeodactylibacter sp.]|nr:T9SS type A sorting domain-containing protein [Phaeodactylibacter sp.]MCB9289236.1 T9SS type A sorting domain-containing protein [Lewinellaceae bacterium]